MVDQEDPAKASQRKPLLQLQQRGVPVTVLSGLLVFPAFVKKDIRADSLPGLLAERQIRRIDQSVIQGDPIGRRRMLLSCDRNLCIANEK